MRHLLLCLVVGCGGSSDKPVTTKPPQHHHHHAESGHRFTRAEDWVPMFDDPARDEWQKPDAVVTALALAPGMTVADLGAGTGYFEAKLAAAVGTEGKVLALDVEPDMVRYMKARFTNTPNIEARVVATDDPQLAPASVDRVLIVDTWHHLGGDRSAYAKKLAAALKPGGFVLIVDFTLETQKGPPPAMRLDKAVVLSELEQGGLRGSVVDVGLPDQYVIRAGL